MENLSELGFEKKEYYEIDYGDFDSFVEKMLGIEYECVEENEWNNYSSYDFSVVESDVKDDPESFFQKYTLAEVEARIRGEDEKLSYSNILEYLAYKGKIPFGNYLIKVFW